MHRSDYKVLIIDDNSDEIALLERFLSRSLIPIRAVEVARTAQEGIEKVRNERPDFIIIGDAYPDMSRGELLEQLSEIISFETLPTLCLINDDATAMSETLRAMKIGVIKKTMLTPEKLSNTMQLLIEQAKVRTERNRAEALFALLSENIDHAIALTDAKGMLVSANKNYLDLFRLDPASIGKQVEEADYAETFHKSAHTSISKTSQNDENGNRLELEVKRLFVEEYGKRHFMLSIYKVIKIEGTEQTHSPATQDAFSLSDEAKLLREFESIHKDALHTLQVIFRAKAKQLPKEKFEQLLQDHNRRMRLIVAASECVTVSASQLKVSTAQYVASIFDIFQKSALMQNNVVMEYQGEMVWIEFSEAILVGLILGELITNALQHAFSSRGGKLIVSFFKEKDESISMTVSDSGVGIPFRVETKPPDAMGLVVVGSLTKKLNGKMEVKRHTGTTFRIVFPQKNTALKKEHETSTVL
jgi:two-component sensor histidine kinase